MQFRTLAKAIAALGVLAPLPALAAPTYLSCSISADGQTSQVDMTIDEGAGQVSFLIVSTGYARQVPGVFRPSEVVFSDGGVRYVVSRTDLSIVRTVIKYNFIDRGQCEIQKAPKRAF